MKSLFAAALISGLLSVSVTTVAPDPASRVPVVQNDLVQIVDFDRAI